MPDLRGTHHFAVIEPVAREAHDLFVHAILHLQQRHHLGLVLHDALHECLAQTGTQGRNTLHRGWQLAVVARQHHARSLANGNPTGRFERLGRLVDEECGILLPVQQAMGRAHERGSDDACLTEKFAVDAYFDLCSSRFQPLQLLMVVSRAMPASAAEFAYGLAYGPQLRIVGMALEAPLVGEREHLVVHTRRIAYAQHVDAAVGELFANPVYGHVALRAHHHLTLTHQRLVDGLHERGGLSRARRPVYNGHVLGPHHLVDGLLLRGIEPREACRGESETGGLLR